MKKKIDSLMIITTSICLLPMILSAFVYNKLPEQVAIHFNSGGTANGYAPRIVAAFGLPLLMAVINLFMHLTLNAGPKKANASKVMILLGKWIICIMTVIIMPITLFMAMGANIPMDIIVPAGVSILIIACGNYLPKSKQNYTIGIKIPWTLNSEENWNKTHQLAGYIWIICGLIMLIASLLKYAILYPIPLGFMVIVPIIYSYVLYKRGV